MGKQKAESKTWLIFSLLTILLVTTILANQSSVAAVEASAFSFFNQLPNWLNAFFQLIMQIGTLFFIAVVALLAWLYGRRGLAVRLVVGASVTWLAAVIIKEFIARERPLALLSDLASRSTALGFGFPSGHTALAAMLLTVLAAEFHGRAWHYALIAVVALVAIGRLYVGVHLPLDVIGGAALGALIGLGVQRIKFPKKQK